MQQHCQVTATRGEIDIQDQNVNIMYIVSGYLFIYCLNNCSLHDFLKGTKHV